MKVPLPHCTLCKGHPPLYIVCFTLSHRWVKSNLFVLGKDVKKHRKSMKFIENDMLTSETMKMYNGGRPGPEQKYKVLKQI